ncbi:MAG: ElyC/SanA/YdcF family protein [Sulfurovaceae bacterium]|nr:ElyC/SanA/YdcF family protein [Sulfurovaceae bacterium]
MRFIWWMIKAVFFIIMIPFVIYAIMSITSWGRIYDDIDRVPAKQTALVLGTTKYISKGEPNPFYLYRIKAAAQLYKRGKVKKILISGDSTTRYYRETALMRKDLIKAGVPLYAIRSDKKGIRTFDSIKRAKEVYGINDYIIVSQKFHLQRAIFLALCRGDNAIGFVASEVEGSAASRKMMARELFARPVALLDLFGLSELYEPWKKEFKDAL